jgi:membrane protein YqaA with SNARE-associated domain
VSFDLNLQSPLLAIASSAVAGFAVGILPIGLAEVIAIAIGAVMPASLAVTMLLVFTASHVASKWIWYVIGSFAERVRHPTALRMIARTREFLARNPAYGPSTLAAGALLSIPPFHLTAIAAGIIRIPVSRFLLICFVGRLLRFGLLALAPSVWRAWAG